MTYSDHLIKDMQFFCHEKRIWTYKVLSIEEENNATGITNILSKFKLNQNIFLRYSVFRNLVNLNTYVQNFSS